MMIITVAVGILFVIIIIVLATYNQDLLLHYRANYEMVFSFCSTINIVNTVNTANTVITVDALTQLTNIFGILMTIIVGDDLDVENPEFDNNNVGPPNPEILSCLDSSITRIQFTFLSCLVCFGVQIARIFRKQRRKLQEFDLREARPLIV